MPDHMEYVQDLAAAHAASALQQHEARPRRAGLSHCESEDCGEPISAERQAMGARLCVPCGKAEESRAAHFRTWGR